MTTWKNHKFPVPDLKNMEICDLPDKDFNIIAIRKLIELYKNKDYLIKVGKEYMNKMRSMTK